MRLFIFHPLSGSVRDLHRFLLTRSAVVVLTGLGGFGGHFVEGDQVEQTPAASEGVALPALAAAQKAPSEPERPSWALASTEQASTEQRARQSVRRSARGESAPLEMARLDAPLSDVPLDFR